MIDSFFKKLGISASETNFIHLKMGWKNNGANG